MDLQYYDELGNYVEVPALAVPGGQEPGADLQAINDELAALGQKYRSAIAAIPADSGYFRCLCYPSTTARYLNLALYEDDWTTALGRSGTIPTVTTYVYDLEKGRAVTLEEALELAGTSPDALLSDLARQIMEDHQDSWVPTELSSVGFRIGADGAVTLYLSVWGRLGGLEFSRIYLWSGDTFTRYQAPPFPQYYEWMSEDTDAGPSLVPAEEAAPLSPALWCRWFFEAGVPENGFSVPPVSEATLAELLVRRGQEDYYLSYNYPPQLTVLLSSVQEDLTLLLVRVEGFPHMVGLSNLVLGVWDGAAQNFAGEVYMIRGDDGRFTSWEGEDGLYLLCANSTTYQGWEGGGSPCYFRFGPSGLELLTALPASAREAMAGLPGDEVFFSDSDDYWQDHKVLPAPGGLELFVRTEGWNNILPTSLSQWSYAGFLPFSQEASVYRTALEALRPRLEDLSREQDPPGSASSQITGVSANFDLRSTDYPKTLAWSFATASAGGESSEWTVLTDPNSGRLVDLFDGQYCSYPTAPS